LLSIGKASALSNKGKIVQILFKTFKQRQRISLKGYRF